MTLGLWFGYFVFEGQLIHSIITSTIVFLIVKVFPKGVFHKVVFIFSMVYLCVSHLYRMYVDYLGWTLDFTGPQMLLTIKFTLYAFDMNDRLKTKDEVVSGMTPKFHWPNCAYLLSTLNRISFHHN